MYHDVVRMSLRRRALWALLAAKLVVGWGVGWDIRWHLVIGRDSFWIAPHLMTYLAVAAAAAISLGVLVVETRRTRREMGEPGTVTVAGLTGTRGFHLAWWGMAIVLLAAPIDDLWHRLFGLDVTLWSPPHLLALAGSQVSNLGGLLIALEVYEVGRARWAALAASGILLLGTFYIMVDQSTQTAFRRGAVFFFTHAVLGSLAFTFALVMRLIPLVPAALMMVADPLRRWRLAAVVFGAALAAVSGGVLARWPALSHALPTSTDTALGLALALAAAVAGGWCGARLADVLTRAVPHVSGPPDRIELVAEKSVV
ncbi:MAG: hypothetical protein DMD95_00880 [Candidatus Rokuibacteriota bacterium]|nr:MAG: hypothetical protein DMD95_00880 [Candidatus Rokubacteria bacterium]